MADTLLTRGSRSATPIVVAVVVLVALALALGILIGRASKTTEPAPVAAPINAGAVPADAPATTDCADQVKRPHDHGCIAQFCAAHPDNVNCKLE